MSGKVHPWWKNLDTSKSFLQVKTVAGFVSRTLPFGSTASVLHFNRAARLLHRIGLELDVVWTTYYDDYPVVEFSFLAANTSHTIKALTSLLGFECSTDKELPFAEEAGNAGCCAGRFEIRIGNLECEKQAVSHGRADYEFESSHQGGKG